jgi:N-acyl homoserine lactone hydrolase
MTNQVIPLYTGALAWPDPATLDRLFHPVWVYLVLTMDGRTMLVDTGNPRSLAGQDRALPWWDARLSMSPEDALDARLAAAGHPIESIDALVATHFDFDHCGNLDLFDAREIDCFVQRDHLDEMTRPEAGERFDRRLWDRSGVRWKPLDGDAVLAPGVETIRTDGHARGHQSLLIETNDGALLLAIDALMDRPSLGAGTFPGFYWEDQLTWSSARSRLLDIAEQRQATLIFGHDPAQCRIIGTDPQPLRLTPELCQSGSP